MNILGITQTPPNFARDTSAVLLSDGVLIGAVAEERFSRIKHHAGYPFNSIKYLLKEAKLKNRDIDYVVIPWGSSSRLNSLGEKWREFKLGQIYNSIRGIKSKRINANVEKVSLENEFPNAKIMKFDHEFSHASSSYRASGFNKALIITLDGEGVDQKKLTSGGIFIGNKGELETLELFPMSASFGYFYGAVTDELGFKHCDGEGKTMGLAAYGDSAKCYDELEIICPQINGIKVNRCKNSDAKKDIGFGYFGVYNNVFFHNLANPYIRYLKDRYGDKNLAAAAQKILEDKIVQLITNAVELTGIKNICLAGGVFLNVKVNKKIREIPGVEDVFIYPNAGDGGATFGAVLELYHHLTGKHEDKRLDHVYLGPAYSNSDIERELRGTGLKFEYVGDDAPSIIADLIERGEVIGWAYNRAEWGPRALGARSVLADPRSVEIKERINNILKRREWFMPFAPSILEDKIGNYVENPCNSPFMIMAFDVKNGRIEDIKGATHVDNTARVHTVNKNSNPRYYEMIKCFEEKTDVPVVLNTSFNRHGLPIVNSPRDALEHLKWGCVDYLAIEDYIVTKS
jgi:carbamoyltransferase